MVQLRALAVFHTGLAGRHRRFAQLLSDKPADQRLRHPFLLGCADDHDGSASHGSRSERGPSGRKESNSLPALCTALAGADARRRQNVQDQGHGRRSTRADSEIRDRRAALHAGEHGGARHGHSSERGPDFGRPRVREQDLECGAISIPQSGEGTSWLGLHTGRIGRSGNSHEGSL